MEHLGVLFETKLLIKWILMTLLVAYFLSKVCGQLLIADLISVLTANHQHHLPQ
jgi:1-acyl-sn-glycerol-3-phosphate acyltransferase